MSHVISDIRTKGTTPNTSTRPSEGFHQELQEAYQETNGKDVDSQIARIDENHEALAQIRMTVVNRSRSCAARDQSSLTEETEEIEADLSALSLAEDASFVFGSPVRKRLNSRALQPSLSLPQLTGMDLDGKLREHLSERGFQVDQHTSIKTRLYRCVRIRFQSMEDWREGTDIARCNPSFHGRERRDWVLVNTSNTHDLAFGRLYALLECQFNGSVCQTALLCMAKKATWKPATVWDNLVLREEDVKQPRFVDPGTFIRAAHLIPAMDATKPHHYFLNDLVDLDWFIRAGN